MHRACLLFVAVILIGIALGQQKSGSQIKVLTVCEVLGDVNRYANTVEAVVGRMERSVSVIDHYEFLSQDRCAHPVITHGHVWSNKIQILAYWEEGMPKPPGDRPKLQQTVVATKLAIVRKTTKLGSHQEPRLTPEGHPSAVAIPNEWAIVYGRILRNPNIEDDCGAAGCGGDDVRLIIIAEPNQIHKLANDETPSPEEK